MGRAIQITPTQFYFERLKVFIMAYLIRKCDLPTNSPFYENSTSTIDLRDVLTQGQPERPSYWEGEDEYFIPDYHANVFQEDGYTNNQGESLHWFMATKKTDFPWADFLEKAYFPDNYPATTPRYLIIRGSCGLPETGGFLPAIYCVDTNDDNGTEIHTGYGSQYYAKFPMTVTLTREGKNLKIVTTSDLSGTNTQIVENAPTAIYFELTGAGGGGGGCYSSYNYASGGGGSGGTICGVLKLSPGDPKVVINLGKGGDPGHLQPSGSVPNGGDGGDSTMSFYNTDGSFDAAIIAPRGYGGGRDSNGLSYGGNGGTSFYYADSYGGGALSQGAFRNRKCHILGFAPGVAGGAAGSAGKTRNSAWVYFDSLQTYANHLSSQKGGTSVADNGCSPGGGGGGGAFTRGGNGRGSVFWNNSSVANWEQLYKLDCHGTKGSGGGGCGSYNSGSGSQSRMGGFGGNGCLTLHLISMTDYYNY